MRLKKKNPLTEQELPGMPPAGVKLSRKEKLKRDIEEYTRAMQGEAGPLIIRSVAADVLGLSTQRVHQLVDAGRLRIWEYFDVKYVSLPEVLDFGKSHRPTGRPIECAA